MRVLITGGLGYVGERLAQAVTAETDYEVVISTRNINNLYEPEHKAEVVKIDWDSIACIESICSGMDVIIHAAGVNALDCIDDPVNALEFNGVTTAKLITSAVKTGVKKFVYLSTAHVYGNPLIGQINEQSCINSTHPYATSHRAGEDTVRLFHEQKRIEGVVLRLSNACGPPVSKDTNCWTLIINDLCKQAVLKKELVLNTSGKQYCNFIPMTDVNNVILHFINMSSSLLGNGVFNIGGVKSLRVIEVANIIKERCASLLGFSPKIKFPSAAPIQNEEYLDYQVSKLLSTGYSHIGEIKEEIDQTLLFCHSAFGNS